MEDFLVEELKKKDAKEVFEIEKTFFGTKNFDSIMNSLSSETLKYFVLKKEKMIVGFLECSIVLDEAEIFDIAIKQEFQGKGLSKLLMNFLFDFCRSKNVRTIFLEVNKTNNKAISLYGKYGFQEYSLRKNYYGNDDAILMKCDL